MPYWPQVEPVASSLNTNDVFVLKSPNSLFLWKGKGSNAEEIAAAKYVASLLGETATEVEETKEPGESWKFELWLELWSLQDSSVHYLPFFFLWSAGFWTALGGKKDYQTSQTLQKIVKPPRLFGCSNKTGRLIVSILRGRQLFILFWHIHPYSVCFFYLLFDLFNSIFRQRRCPVSSLKWIWQLMMSWFWTPGIRYAVFTFN